MNPVEDYIVKVDPQKRRLVEILRHFILSTDPMIKEKISYGIPFFYINRNICYLNPVQKGVDLGFIQGRDIHLEKANFQLKNRKQVKTLNYSSEENIDFVFLDKILKEAISLDSKRK